MSLSAIVIGAGVVGLATARALAEKNYRVTVFERSEKCVGASIRNFGMIWPIGQPSGILYERAMRSQYIWKQLCAEAGIWYNPCGSLLNAYDEDELVVIEEFVSRHKSERDIALLTPSQTIQKSPATNLHNLKASLWSSTEVIVDPREAIAVLPDFLQQKYDVTFHFGQVINAIEYPSVYCGRKKYEADLIVVCSGADFETLYPEVFAQSGITKCKLQMLRTISQADGWSTGPALCGGLTLTHYGSFEECSSLAALKKRIENEMPDYVKWGIHVMISQNGLGEVTIGDSHEYGLTPDPFDRDEINQLILRYLQRFCKLQDPHISQTWNGIYAKLKGKTEFVSRPESGVLIVNGLSGAGMTLSFGLAEELVADLIAD